MSCQLRKWPNCNRFKCFGGLINLTSDPPGNVSIATCCRNRRVETFRNGTFRREQINSWSRLITRTPPLASVLQSAIAACALLAWTESANGTMPTWRALYVLLPASELWMYGCSAQAFDATSFPLHIQHKRAGKETYLGTSFRPITTVMAVVPGPFGWVH